MFETACIPMVITRATLKREMDDEEPYRVADLAITIEPFKRELAEELGKPIADHLFDAAGQMRSEVHDISLALRVGDQRVIVASAPDAPALATLEGVRVNDVAIVRKTKGDREWYRATLSARIDLRDREIREFLFQQFGELRCFTFFAEQGDLLRPGRDFVAANQRLMEKHGGSSVEISGPDGKGVRITKDGVESIQKPH